MGRGIGGGNASWFCVSSTKRCAEGATLNLEWSNCKLRPVLLQGSTGLPPSAPTQAQLPQPARENPRRVPEKKCSGAPKDKLGRAREGRSREFEWEGWKGQPKSEVLNQLAMVTGVCFIGSQQKPDFGKQRDWRCVPEHHESVARKGRFFDPQRLGTAKRFLRRVLSGFN